MSRKSTIALRAALKAKQVQKQFEGVVKSAVKSDAAARSAEDYFQILAIFDFFGE
jgi:hypothetical protein